jgi:CRP/FNR family cyclic AMP-dependent transcriptional regulator
MTVLLVLARLPTPGFCIAAREPVGESSELTPGGCSVSIPPSTRERVESGEVRVSISLGRRSQLLAGCPLFGGLDTVGLEAVAAKAAQVEFPAGHVIARQGEIGTGFFVIVDGRVRVVRDGDVVATLGPGEFFGELSVLDRLPRSAMVAADVPTTCLALAAWDFEAVLLEQPRLALAILRGVAARLRQLTDSVRH